jgi:hypothetical protein
MFFSFMYTYYEKPFLPVHEIYVFGSNIQGVHGAGTALVARKHYGARIGVGKGICGQSYAIPTRQYKDKVVTTLDHRDVVAFIQEFVQYTNTNRLKYYVTNVGMGYAGFTLEEIAPHFKGARGCWLPVTFRPFLESN